MELELDRGNSGRRAVPPTQSAIPLAPIVMCQTCQIRDAHRVQLVTLLAVAIRSRPSTQMTKEEIVAIGLRYQERFGNIDRIGHPKIALDPKFGELMEAALKVDAPLTCITVAQVFPDITWDF